MPDVFTREMIQPLSLLHAGAFSVRSPQYSGFAASRMAVARMGAAASEFRPFLSEPPQMSSGAAGKAGYLSLAFEHDAEQGRTVLSAMDRRVPLLAQKALYWEESQPGMACVIVIAATGCTVQGDRLALDVSAGPGSRALVTTQCAAKIHSMEHNYASQLQRFRLGEESYLEYMPDALILHRSARYLQDTLVTLPASASFVYGEILVPGRRWHHEEELFGFDIYSAGLRVMRPGAEEEERGWDPSFGFGMGNEAEEGEILFEERLVLEPDETEFRNVAVMGGFEVLGKFYKTESATVEGAGVLDITTQYVSNKSVGNVVIKSDIIGTTIVGFENHSGRVDIGAHTPLGKVLAGFGHDGKGTEGVIYKNVIATYLHGPLLPKNPVLADYILAKAIEKRYGETELAPLDDTLEIAAHDYAVGRFASE